MENIDTISNWMNSYYTTLKSHPFLVDRLKHSFEISQLQSKKWISDKLSTTDLHFTNTIIIGGWYCHVLADILNPFTNYMCNYETDPDAVKISKRFNRHIADKFTSRFVDLYMDNLNKEHVSKGKIDLVVNTSCEHMYPFYMLREKIENQINSTPLYVLQSTDEKKYRDHINTVKNVDELIEQAKITRVWYKGSKVLANGMNRFMVIGK